MKRNCNFELEEGEEYSSVRYYIFNFLNIAINYAVDTIGRMV